jgi:hypothetical protein
LFDPAQIRPELSETSANHSATLSGLDLPGKVGEMFTEEAQRVQAGLDSEGIAMLAILPGKHLLGLLTKILGFSKAAELTNLVIRSLNRKQLKENEPLLALGKKLESALLAFLPPRSV